MMQAVTRRRLLAKTTALSVASLLWGGTGNAQPFPGRPIHVLVGGAAGSVPDMVARVIGDKLSAALGQSVIVENRPGASGMIAMQALVGSAPDGYTLALATMSQAVFNTYLFSKLPYDPLRDLEPISPLVIGAMAVAAHPSVPANTLGEFISLAKAQPGKLSIGTAGNGSPPDLVARLLARAAGIDVAFIPFRTGPEGLTGVMRGDVQLFVDAPPMIAPQVRAGTVKVLVVTGRTREPELPRVQTVAEAGFPDLQGEAWIGLVAPAHTPTEIVARLNREIAAMLAASDVQQRLAILSFRPFVVTADEFRTLIRQEHDRWGAIIREAGIKLD
jgi:tripartite-type tricarboxylate transporter receptor subunit TctC